MSRCTDISARPVSLSCPVALRKYVFKRLRVEQVRSAVADETGKVATTFSRKCIFVKNCRLQRDSDGNGWLTEKNCK